MNLKLVLKCPHNCQNRFCQRYQISILKWKKLLKFETFGEIFLDFASSVTRLGNLLDFGQRLATTNLPKYLTFLDNFCKGVKIYLFSSEIQFGPLLKTFGDFYLVTLFARIKITLKLAPEWPDDQIVISIFGHLQQWKFGQKHTNCAKVSKNFVQN